MKQLIRLLCNDYDLCRMATLILIDSGYEVTASPAHCPLVIDLDSAALPGDRKYTAVVGICRDPMALEPALASKCRTVVGRPLDFGEFLTAVDDAVNNVNKQTISPPRAHRAPDLVLNTADLTLSCGGRQVKLTPAEAALFSLLSDNKGAAVSYARLSETVGSSSSNKVEVHVCALRRKLGQIYSRPLIVTVRGEGYKLG